VTDRRDASGAAARSGATEAPRSGAAARIGATEAPRSGVAETARNAATEVRPGLARRVTALALPALVVLAAEPLYVLVDTAIVGHLGRVPLAGLAAGGVLMAASAWLGNVLAYGTTGRAARRYGAGNRAAAVTEGVQASWLAVGIGLAMVVLAQLFAGPVMAALVGGGPDAAEVRAAGELWFRIASLGSPAILLSLAGNGWMRGVQDTRRPVRYVLAGNLLSMLLCPLLVYGTGLGLAGSAIANVAAQYVAAALFVRALRAEGVTARPQPALIRAQLSVGRDLVLRTAAIQASFLSAAAVASRLGAGPLAGHQIALQLFIFLALVLDSLAIAAQSLVGEALGAGRRDEVRAVAWRVAGYGGLAGTLLSLALLATHDVLPRLFTSDPHVLAATGSIWLWLVAIQPAAGVVFALDGVLIGAGDVRFLRNITIISTAAGFLPLVWLAHGLGLGLAGVWAGLLTFVLIRLVGMVLRVAGRRWTEAGEADVRRAGIEQTGWAA
jgi:putative MATE family efflux protein